MPHHNNLRCLVPNPKNTAQFGRRQHSLARSLAMFLIFLNFNAEIINVNFYCSLGEVPNLFESDEYEKVIQAVRPFAKEAGISEGNRDKIYEYFISRVRSKLHVVLCMSPIGDAFRRRCRMFPSLVNCCTIDWFLPWPTEALLSVAEDSFKNVVENPELGSKLSSICVTMHEVSYFTSLLKNFKTVSNKFS